MSVSQWSPICSTYRKHCTVLYSFTTYYRVWNYIYTTSATNESGSTDHSGAPEFTPVFSGVHLLFNFLHTDFWGCPDPNRDFLCCTHRNRSQLNLHISTCRNEVMHLLFILIGNVSDHVYVYYAYQFVCVSMILLKCLYKARNGINTGKSIKT